MLSLFLGAGTYDHYVPGVVDAVLQRGELLTAYTPYQREPAGDLRVPDGDLRADRAGRRERIRVRRLRRRGRRVPGRPSRDRPLEDRARRGCQPAGASRGQDLRARLRHGRGRCHIGTAPPTRTTSPRPASTRPAPCSSSRTSSAAWSPLRRWRRLPRAGSAGRRARRSALLGVLEAPGVYGCAMAIGEGQGAGNAMSFGGPHYGFLLRKQYVRRLPGRIVGMTTDVHGERGFVLTFQTREQHIRRERARRTSPRIRLFSLSPASRTSAGSGPRGSGGGREVANWRATPVMRSISHRRSTSRASRRSPFASSVLPAT